MGKVVSMIIRFASPARMNRTCSSAVAAIAAGFAVAGLGLTIGSHDVRAESWPASVDASYRINFNGFDIGSFQFTSEVGPNGYRLNGDAEISILLGAIKWRGITRSAGRIAKHAPKPSAYLFNFRSNSKSGSVSMNFDREGISNVSRSPQKAPASGEVPLERHHLKGVMDPMSAVMALSRTKHGIRSNPCKRKLSIFDGKQRFDLRLSYRRQEAISDASASGQPGIAIVCGVRYVPIAGYKPNSETKSMAANDGIEIALRPIPSADLFVPFEIRIPTIAGTVTLTSDRVNITTKRRKRIALVY